MVKPHFGPIITAAVTPFDDQLQIDLKKFEKLLTHLIDTGTTALVITGTTGEAPTLSAVDKLKLWEFAIDFVDERIPVIVGVGTNNTKTTLHNVKLAEEVGADGLLVVVPYYNKPSQKGLYRHFKEIAESTELPIILYNIPARCGTGLEAKTILELQKIPNIIGIKDSTGDLELITAVKEKGRRDFLLYSGDDSLYFETLKIGGSGVVSVASHIVGKSMKRVYDLYISGFEERAATQDAKLQPVYKELFRYPNPAPIKSLLNSYGIDVGGLRMPLIELEKYEHELITEKLFGLIDI